MKIVNNQVPDLSYLGLAPTDRIYYQLTPARVIEFAIRRNEGVLTDTGALAVDTGAFTGRSPKDRYLVYDEITANTVWWGDTNIRFGAAEFDRLYLKVVAYPTDKEIFVRDSSACASEKYHTGIRVITENAYQGLFVHHLLIRPALHDPNDQPEWTVIAAPGFMAEPGADGTRQHNFSIINFTRRVILIGGTGYTGEIKKGIFTVLNFILPHDQKVLTMHCSANTSSKGETAIFFGLSGTGKTTLSADGGRDLIGDDEHGWSEQAVFNIEGGCYAKCNGLTAEREPQIFTAIRYGALLENVNFFPATSRVNFSDTRLTENTRVAYPLDHVGNAVRPSIAAPPKNIFFLTADAFGVLPPIAKLTHGQALYHFIAGYTAKIAGTETGITEPKATFSACFGEAFLPLHPLTYARMLGQKIKDHQVSVWLINTGWTGGAYGAGHRIKLAYTRAMVRAVLNGSLEENNFRNLTAFCLAVPESCPEVPEDILDPRHTWPDPLAYDEAEAQLAALFTANFKKYQSEALAAEISVHGPALSQNV